MNDAFRVSFVERGDDLACDAKRFVEWKRTAKRLALDVLHDQVVRPDVVQRADVRVIQRRDRVGFTLEAIAELLGGHLDRHFAVQPRVVGAVDFAHASDTDRRGDFIRAQPVAGNEWHGWREFYSRERSWSG